MRKFFIFTIVFIVVVIGFTIYVEVQNRQFIQNLPQGPIELSVETRQQSPPNSGNTLRETKLTTEVFVETLKQYEGKFPEQQEMPAAPERHRDVSLNQNAETPETSDPNWWNDEEFPHSSSQDPWHQEDMSMKFINWEELSENEQLSMAHKSMLKKFGDIPQVHTIIAFDNKPKHLPTTIDEAIAHTEACLYLWPDETTHQSLLHLKHLKASGFKQFPGVE